MSDYPQGGRVPGTSEEEPLLGARGDASLPEGKSIWHNLIIGTGALAQIGAWVLVVIVWGSVFSQDLMLFSAHPLVNSAAFLFLIQALLILQPTHTAKQKTHGTYAHAAFNDLAFLAAVAGLVIIEYNKTRPDHEGGHFESIHGKLGLTTYILIVLQAFVGATQYFVPSLYGGVENAKQVYKYHRVGGYITVVVMLATICAATQTGFNETLGIQLWAVIVCSVLVVVGLVPRIRLSKFGWLAGK